MADPWKNDPESYKVPNEEEIHEKLDMDDKMNKLAHELEEKQRELEYLKERALEKKIKDIEDKKVQLNKRLGEIDEMPDWDSSESKMKMIEAKKRINKWEEQEREKQDELIAYRKEKELEKIVRKKMELERLMEDKKSLNNAYRHINTELDVIREEREKKEMDSVKLLEKALERGNVLKDQIKKGALDDRDKALLAETYLQNTVKSKEEQERLLAEIQANRFQEAQKTNIDTKEKIKNLNDIRFALREKEEKLIKQKALHHELMKKGVDYLAQIELGNAPPLEYIEKNIKYDPDNYRNNKTLNDVLRNGENYMQNAQENIERLEEERERLEAYIAKQTGQYNGELKPFLAKCNPNSLDAARFILEIVLSKVFSRIDEEEKVIHQARKDAEHLQGRAQKVDVRKGFFVFSSATKGLSTNLLEKVVDAMVRELAFEMYNINEEAKRLAGTILFRSLRIERNFKKSDNELESGFFDLRGDNRKRARDNYKLMFKDREDIREKDVKAAGAKKQGKQDQIEDQVEYAQTEFDPERECVENLGSFETRKLELGYFERVQLEDNDVIDIFSKIKGGIMGMVVSPNGKLLAVSTTNGIIGIVNLTLSPPKLSYVIEDSGFSPYILRFSDDSSSQLVALDQNGLLKTYLLTGNPSAKNGSLSWHAQKDVDLRPLEMTEYYTVDWKFISRPKQKIPNEKEYLQITQCGFFSTYNLLGFQSNLLVGTRNGTLMKFNSNKKLGGTFMQNALFKTTNIKPIPKMEADVNKDIDQIKAKPGPKGSEPHLYREFFNGHQSEIIYITTVQRPNSILTIDKEGRIFLWEYNGSYLGEDSTFQTKERFKVKLDVTTYQPVNEKTQTFPPKDAASQATIPKQGETKFNNYDKSMDFKSRVLNAKKTSDLGLTEVTVCKKRFPQPGEVETFQFITFNYQEKRVILEQEQDYKAVSSKGFVGNVQGSANNRFIHIQLILPHKLKTDSSNIVFVGFNTATNNIRKFKVTLEVPKLESGVDFLVSDNFAPMGSSYIYMLLRDGIYVISTATGLIVRIFKDHLQKIDKAIRTRFEFDQLQVFKNKEIFLASSGSGLIWRFNLKDTNSRDDFLNAKNDKGELLQLLDL